MADTTNLTQEEVLTYEGLKRYDSNAKTRMENADAKVLDDAKAYFDDNADQFDPAGSAATAEQNAKAYTDELANGAVKENTEAIAKLNGDAETEGSVAKAVADGVAEAKLYADGKDEAIQAAKKAGDDAQADVDTLEQTVAGMYTNTQIDEAINVEKTRAEAAEKANADYILAINDSETGILKQSKDYTDAEVKKVTDTIGEVTDGKTVVEMIADAKTHATYDDTDVKAGIQENKEAIALLNDDAEVEGSVDYKIAQAVASIMENPDETMNSINELVTWINGHAEDALELSNQVTANKDDIAALELLVGDTAVATQITEAIANALTIDGVDKYALATDLTAAIGRVAALEAKAHEHANKEVLDGISAEKVSAWDSAEQNAKDYADELVEGVDLSGIATNAADIDKLEASLAEGGATANAIAEAKQAGTDAQTAVTELQNGAVATNTQAIADNATEIEAIKTAMPTAITNEQIDALFEEATA